MTEHDDGVEESIDDRASKLLKRIELKHTVDIRSRESSLHLLSLVLV